MSQPILECDACGLPVEFNPRRIANYDGVYHSRCANPTVTDEGLLIGYDGIVIGFDEDAMLEEIPAERHTWNCDCKWCSPLTKE